ncbi:telomeric repeat-binding factor 2-interacting protein 1-like isoform X1 [Acropora millepora]|uniref:telomeric repeat-binding factor 2-interacting protein 1-like isoform X1 n=1 Tax=Acropora millepora TaxID=45264 RepID=UPI001CF2AF99|nr:telomeric repeat-binding factor 2-interacting protein 1-like isoform X1 [Acropora millepora]
MAENGKDAFPKCSTLFLREDGSPMLFYLTPGSMKTRLKPLILHGGGELSSKVLSNSIKLADPTVAGGNMPGYLSTEYIFDCIKHNKLQDMENYRLEYTSSNNIKGKGQAKPSPSKGKLSGPSGTGRSVYTDEEDLALIKFVKENNFLYSIKGNNLYKEAEKSKVTSHTWQSMRDHYIKVLYKRREPKNKSQLLFKTKKEKSTDILKEKMLNPPASQPRQTRLQTTVTPRKHKGDKDKQDAREESELAVGRPRKAKSQTSSPAKNFCNESSKVDAVAGHSRKTRSQTASPTKKIDNVQPRDLATFSDTVTDFTSGDNADDERSAGEDTDYDKQFDEDLLRIAAAESKVEKERPRFENAVKEDMHRQKKTHKRNILSDFEGEIVTKEDFKRVSNDEDEDKRPMAKKNKGNHSFSTDIKESQENEKFVRRFHELQLNLQRLESQWTVPQVIHALLVTSGSFNHAQSYLQNGTAGKEYWGYEEDKILLSKDKEAISNLAKTRGLQSVVDRMNFMEGIRQ